MTKEELIIALKKLNNYNDEERAHGVADRLILQYINDKEIEQAFHSVNKFYA